MKARLVIGIVLSAILSSASFAQTNYKIVDRVKVPDGGFDYATFDSATGRVLMAPAVPFMSASDIGAGARWA